MRRETFNNKVGAFKEEIKKLQKDKAAFIQKQQRSCIHPRESILQALMVDKGWLGTDLPIRVCLDCGLGEQGWTYKVIGKGICDFDLPRASHDEVIKQRLSWTSDYIMFAGASYV